jgi:hypothetical protein
VAAGPGRVSSAACYPGELARWVAARLLGPVTQLAFLGGGAGRGARILLGGTVCAPVRPCQPWKYLVKQIIYVLELFLFVARAPATHHNVGFKLLKTGGPLR